MDGGESVDRQAVANRWSVSRWSVVDEKQNGDHWLPTTGYRLPTTDHRYAGESVLGRTEGGRLKEGSLKDRGTIPRLHRTAEGWIKRRKARPNRVRRHQTEEGKTERKKAGLPSEALAKEGPVTNWLACGTCRGQTGRGQPVARCALKVPAFRRAASLGATRNRQTPSFIPR